MKIKFTSNRLPLSYLIRLWCFSKVSHVEFVFSDGVSIYPAVETGRTILTKKTYTNEYIFDLNLTAEQEAKVRQWAESQIGVIYDYTALAPFNWIIPRAKSSWKDPKFWMCSEFCAYGLELVGIKLFDDAHKKIKPSDLYVKVKEKFKEE